MEIRYKIGVDVLYRLNVRSPVLLLLSLSVSVAATDLSNPIDRALQNYWTSRGVAEPAPTWHIKSNSGPST